MGLLIDSTASLPTVVPLHIFTQPRGIIVLITLSILLLRYVYRTLTHETPIVNISGTPMKEYPYDTRFSRFTHGFMISDEGKYMAGDEPFIVRNSGKREVVLTTPEHLRDFYKNDVGVIHFKPKNMNLGYYFGRILGECVGVKGGSKWSVIRQHAEPHFSHNSAKGFIESWKGEFEGWLQELPKEKGVLQHSDGFSIDALAACRFIPFKLIAMACYGDALTPETYRKLLEFNTMRERIMHNAVFNRKLVSRWYNIIPSPETRELSTFLANWESFNLSIVASSPTCPVAIIYSAVESKSMTKEEWLQTVDEILFTNIDVTSSVLAFLLINLAKNGDVQSSLRNEILSNTSDVYEYIHKQKTKMHNVIMESLRICPAAWFSYPELSSSHKFIGGFAVPAGTPTIIDWKRINTKSSIWGRDGDTFRPSRFDELSPAQHRYSFLQFGIGTRKCLGKNMSNVMLKLFLITVLKRFELAGVVEKGEIKLKDEVFTCSPEQVVRFVERG